MKNVIFALVITVCLGSTQGLWELTGFENENVKCIAQHPQDTSTMLVAIADSIFCSSDGGYSWSCIADFMGLPINYVMYDPIYYDTLYALLGNGSFSDGIYRSTDGGYTWGVVTWFLFPKCMVITTLGIPAHIILVGCDGLGVFKSEDGGNTWDGWNDGLIDSHVYAVDYCAPFDSFPKFFAGTSQGLFFRLSDLWTQATGIAINVRVSSICHLKITNLGFATVTGGSWSDGIYRSTDFGQNWQAVDWWIYTSCVAVNPQLIYYPYPIDTASIFAGDSGLGVKYSTDCGGTWQQVNSGLGNLYINLLSYHPQDSTRLFAATQGGLYRYVYPPGICEDSLIHAGRKCEIMQSIVLVNEPIPIKKDKYGRLSIKIFDAAGRLIRNEVVFEYTTRLEPLEKNGVYFIVLRDDNYYKKKIVVIE